jgi:hypothetical protein
MPLTAFYDPSGELIDVHLGFLDEAALRANISRLYGIEA